jgi:unsaturated rhamnogalacturonyl hydrolase
MKQSHLEKQAASRINFEVTEFHTMKKLAASHVFHERAPQIPEGKRVPFSARYFGLPADGTPVRLFFPICKNCDSDTKYIGPARLRFICAMDVREERLVEVCINGDPTPIGVLDIRFAYIQQPFDLEVCGEIAQEIMKNGVRIRMTKGEQDTFFFFDQEDNNLCPGLILSDMCEDKIGELRNQLLSTSSIQPFGWMEGCVLDGLSSLVEKGDFAALSAITMHLEKFIVNGSLVYEDPRGNICDDKIYGIEAGLPFAIMALHGIGENPIKLFKSFVESVPIDAVITDSEFISAEGSYTVAYPLALMGRLQSDQTLIDRAVKQLLVRKEALREGNDLYLRSSEGHKSFKNWGRAYVWYLMGLVHVLHQMKLSNLTCPLVLLTELQEVADLALSYFDDGLCPVFFGEPETGVETSASAGIGAALALGVQFALLDRKKYQDHIEKIKLALLEYLTPDGMLEGVGQSNRDGERLQRSGYRVISQMGMGLMAHLL